MYMKYGKVIFGYKDTFGLNYTLRPIIQAGLVKFKENLEIRYEKGACFGIPFLTENEDIDESTLKWFAMLDKMIYAFDDKAEPDSSKYNFDLTWGEPNERGGRTVSIRNQAEADRYHKDCKEHEDRVKEGLRLFAEYFDQLWW